MHVRNIYVPLYHLSCVWLILYVYVCTHTYIIIMHVCMITIHLTDFTELKNHYHAIIRLMPKEYEITVGKLQNNISDDKICVILNSSNSTTANKIILDCLIEGVNCREELLDLCDQLEIVTTSQDMKIIINEIRLG